MLIQAKKIEERFAAILTSRIACTKIAPKNTNAETGMLKITELMYAPNLSNSSQVFRTYTIYSLYLSTFFSFLISLYQNTLATLHQPAQIYWFVFPLLILQRRHSFNLLLHLFFWHRVYCFITIQSCFIVNLYWFYSLVAFCDI